MEDKNKAYEDAEAETAEKEKELNTAKEELTKAETALKDAQDTLSEAKDGKDAADKAVKEAETKADEAVADVAEKEKAVTDAEKALKDAEADLAEKQKTADAGNNSKAFFKWLSENAKTAAEKEDAGLAYRLLDGTESTDSSAFNHGTFFAYDSEGNKLTAKDYKTILKATDITDPNDATNLKNFRTALDWLNTGNTDYREKGGLKALKVSSTLMADSEINANYMAETDLEHTLTFCALENAAYNWPGMNPYDMWHDEEKKEYDAGNEMYAGHYKTLMDLANGAPYEFSGYGYAISTKGAVFHSQHFAANNRLFSHTYTGVFVSEYRKYLDQYEESLTADVKKAEEAVNAAKAEKDKADQALTDAKAAQTEADKAVEDAKKAADEAAQKVTDAEAAVKKAEDNKTDAEKKVTSAEEKLAETQRKEKAAKDDVDKAKADLAEKEQETADKEKELKAAEADRDAKKNALAKADQEVSEKEKSVEDAQKTVDEKTQAVTDLTKKLSDAVEPAEKALNDAKDARKAAEDKKAEKEKEASDASAALKAAEEAAQNAEKAAADAKNAKDEADRALAEAEKADEDAKKALKECEKKNKALTDAKEAADAAEKKAEEKKAASDEAAKKAEEAKADADKKAQTRDGLKEEAERIDAITLEQVLAQTVAAPDDDLNAYGKAYADAVTEKETAETEKNAAEKARDDAKAAAEEKTAAKEAAEKTKDDAQKAYDAIVITSMEVTLSNTSYTVGDKFDETTVKVTVTHQDGTTEEVKDAEITAPSIPETMTPELVKFFEENETDMCDGKVTYHGKTQTIMVAVKANKYEIIKGAGQKITKGEEQDTEFVSNASIDVFAGIVLIDGEEITADKYRPESGSTKITLNKAYVETLAVGEHTITVVSKDGSAKASFTVEEKKEEEPKPEDPKPEDPKPEDPKKDDPKPEEPKKDEPKPEEPKKDDKTPEKPADQPKKNDQKPATPATADHSSALLYTSAGCLSTLIAALALILKRRLQHN